MAMLRALDMVRRKRRSSVTHKAPIGLSFINPRNFMTAPRFRPFKLPIAIASSLALLAGLTIWRSRAAERALPKHKRILVDGVELHWLDRGSGPALVLLHGNGSMIEDFQTSGLIDLAASKYRVLAFDRPGFGHSTRPADRKWTAGEQAEIIQMALQRLDVQKAIVLGHSWGTLVAVALALRAPGLVDGLVLTSGYYFPWQRGKLAILTALSAVFANPILRFTTTPLCGRLLWPLLRRILFSPAPVAANFKRFPIEIALRPSQLKATAAETALLIPTAAAFANLYADLQQPVTILAGDGDKLVGRRQALTLHDKLRTSRIAWIGGAGHMVHQTAPDRIFAEIDRLAERIKKQQPESESLPT